jgi:NADPH:quinone reductase-like Zn-dependent oxidoreductase
VKAAFYERYGGPEQLTVRDVAAPTPRDNEILVRVLSVALNASDLEFLRGVPRYTRMWGLLRPGRPTLGSDCAGRVEAVGSRVTRFKVGDLVFADLLERWGALAELVAAPEHLWAALPEDLSPEVACMIPQAGVVAWQSVQALGSLDGKRVLINGAGGGSGTFAIQMAKLLGASHVTAVDAGEKADAMQRLGADRTVDFRAQDYTTSCAGCDLVVDLIGSRSLSENARVLARNGKYYLVGGSLPRIFAVLSLGTARSLLSARKFRLFATRPSPAAITEVAGLCRAGQITPQLGQRFSLDDVRGAFEALASGRVLGKVVVVP